MVKTNSSQYNDALLTSMKTGILCALVDKENELDSKIAKIQGYDEDDFEKIRYNRRRELINTYKQENAWKALGNGVFEESSGELEFFDACKKVPLIVAHFYKNDINAAYSAIFDRHLKSLSQKQIGIKFLKVNVEKHEFLCTKLSVFVLPTLVLIKEMNVVHKIVGFDELGNDENFTELQLINLIKTYGFKQEYEPTWYKTLETKESRNED